METSDHVATTLYGIQPRRNVVAHVDWRGFCVRREEGDVHLNELAEKCHAVAVSKGWYEKKRPFTDLCLLLHTEVSEMAEEWRAGRTPTECYYNTAKALSNGWMKVPKPEGIPSELADLIIRALDMCDYYGIDIDAAVEEKIRYNELRPMRHGGKRI